MPSGTPRHRSAGLTLSDLVRRSVGRVRTWTVAHAEVERERTRQVARIGNNLNQIACWANYLLGTRDATGQPRPGVEVLRGDPHQVAAVADALAFEHKYTSGVIAWAPDDAPTDAQIGAVLDAFERTAWAGLEPDRYAWAGRAAPRARRRCSRARPSRAVRPRDRPEPQHRASGLAEDVRSAPRRLQRRRGLEAEPRDLIRDYLIQRVELGTVRNRADVVSALREAGLEVPRQGKNYLTLLDPETGDRWRLKGELYAHDFQREGFDRAAAETAGDRTPGDRGIDRERARAARREERAAYHRAR